MKDCLDKIERITCQFSRQAEQRGLLYLKVPVALPAADLRVSQEYDSYATFFNHRDFLACCFDRCQ